MDHRKILTQVRGELVRKREELQGTLDRTVVRIKDGSDRMADVLDRATVEHDRTVELMIRGRESDQIREIQEAIRRIDEGQFGVCHRCGKAISPRRLRLAPLSRLCTACKEKTELISRGGAHAAHLGVEQHAY
ncbi:MAG: TraR/DksA family transcriptional regulator [Deltaproteobacteria bacterium]|nr:TraR/DksA family transcriptional regulator [Deltaproteobacteria bacterium]